jgi:hypothetical protein
MTTPTPDTMNTITLPSRRWDHHHQEWVPEVGSPLWSLANRAEIAMDKARARGPEHEIIVAKRYMSNPHNSIHVVGGCRRSQRGGRTIVPVSVEAIRMAVRQGERVCATCLRKVK